MISMPTPIGLPTQFGAGAPALQPGQIVEAVVLALLENGSVRLALPSITLDVRSTVPLVPGSTVRLAVRSSGAGLQLVILPPGANQPASAAAAPSPDPGQSGNDSPSAMLNQPAGQGASAASGGSQPAVEISIQGAANTTRVALPQPTPSPAAVGAGAVADAVRIAAARQDGLAPLIADVAQVVAQAPEALPPPVLAAAAQLLNLRVPLDETLSPEDIRQALSRSGLFLEARLVPPDPGAGDTRSSAASTAAEPADVSNTSSGALPARPPPGAPAAAGNAGSPPVGAQAAAPSSDLKAALLVLRQAVRIWIDQAGAAFAAAPAAVSRPGGPAPATSPLPADGSTEPMLAPSLSPTLASSLPPTLAASLVSALAASVPPSNEQAMALPAPHSAPPPPFRGAAPTAQPAVAASLSAASSLGEVARRLLSETDAALARHTLLQAASLPDQAESRRAEPHGPQWVFEVPFTAAGGTSIAQFEIGRDGQAVTADGRTIWRARFSLDVEPMGPVHAQVSLIGERAAVLLWAERDGSAALLRDNRAMLAEALKAAELDPGDIQCRAGAPVAPRNARPVAGRFLDCAS